jgi:hypothetical protein
MGTGLGWALVVALSVDAALLLWLNLRSKR